MLHVNGWEKGMNGQSHPSENGGLSQGSADGDCDSVQMGGYLEMELIGLGAELTWEVKEKQE